jgi:hypothetical protein
VRPVEPLAWFSQAGAAVLLPVTPQSVLTGASPAEQVQADATGDRRQPGAGGFDGVLLLPAQGVPAGVGLLVKPFQAKRGQLRRSLSREWNLADAAEAWLCVGGPRMLGLAERGDASGLAAAAFL